MGLHCRMSQVREVPALQEVWEVKNSRLTMNTCSLCERPISGDKRQKFCPTHRYDRTPIPQVTIRKLEQEIIKASMLIESGRRDLMRAVEHMNNAAAKFARTVTDIERAEEGFAETLKKYQKLIPVDETK